jgi:hypothetical protein
VICITVGLLARNPLGHQTLVQTNPAVTIGEKRIALAAVELGLMYMLGAKVAREPYLANCMKTAQERNSSVRHFVALKARSRTTDSYGD